MITNENAVLRSNLARTKSFWSKLNESHSHRPIPLPLGLGTWCPGGGGGTTVRHRSRPISPHRALAHGPLETFTQDVANFEHLNPKHKLVRKD